MKTKTVLLIAIVSLLVGIFVGGFFGRSKGPDPDYWISRDEYNQTVKDMEAGLQESLRLIAERDKTIRLQDEFVALGQRKIIELEETQKADKAAGVKLKDENARLKADAQAAIDANPAVRALVANYDLRCENYEKQVFTLTQSGAEKDKVIEAKDIQIVALAYQRDTWKKEWDKEHKARLLSDNLRLDLEKDYKTSKFWETLGKWGPPIAFGLGFILAK